VNENINLIIGPNLFFDGTKIEPIPVEKIIGLDFIRHSPTEKVLCCVPIPVAIPVASQYELIPSSDLLKPDLNGSAYSHLSCIVLPTETDEEKIQKAMVTIENIQANRTLKSRKEISERLQNSPFIKKTIDMVYGLDSIKSLSKLLLGNGYSERHQRRLSAVKKATKESPSEKEDKPIASTPQTQHAFIDPIKRWGDFCKRNPGVWSFEKIVNAFPIDNQGATSQRLSELIRENPDDFISVWETVKSGLKKKGLWNE